MLTLAWFGIYAHWNKVGLCDEPGQVDAICHFYEGRPGWPELLPYLPGYHYLVIGLSFGPPTMLKARLVTLLTAFGTMAAFGWAWRRFHQKPAGAAVLLLALIPILQPYNAMAYTDPPALMFVMAAWAAQLTGRDWLSAGLIALACFQRQTSILWGSFLLGWEALRAWENFAADRTPLWKRVALAWWQRGRWLILLHAIVAGIVLYTGRLTTGTQHGNSARANIATLHTAALLVLLLGLPIWLMHAGNALRWIRDAFRTHPRRAIALSAVALGASALFALTFANPHVWNRELWWADCSFTLLRNWPLVYIDHHQWAQVASGINIVAMSAALLMTFARQPHRNALWLTVFFSALLLCTNDLVEPRYFITTAVLIVFFLDWTNRDRERRVLTAWWALLCLVHAPFIALNLSLW